MSDDKDETQKVALYFIGAIVGAVVIGTVAFGAWTGLHGADRPAAASVAAAEPEGRIYFEIDSSALPGEAQLVVVKVLELAKAQPKRLLLISGFHDASGDAAHNAELAKQRAMAVREALIAAGLAAEQLQMEKPAMTTGGADPREARRVELRLR